MKKNNILRLFVICMIAMFVISGSTDIVSAEQSATVSNGIKVLFNGAEMKLEGELPFVENKNLMLPVKDIVEEFGATVTMNESGQMIIDNYKHVIAISLGNKTITVDKGQRCLSDYVVNKNGVFYAPSDLFAQDFDIAVNWDKETNTCNLTTKAEVEDVMIDDMQIASIRFRGQYSEIADYYLALKKVVGNDGIGGGFSLYYDQDYVKGHDIEISMQITKPIDPVTTTVNGKEVTVSSRVLKGGHFLSATHLGNSNTIQYLWEQIEQYAKDKNVNYGSPSREIYVYEDFNDYRKQVTTAQILVIDNEEAGPQVQNTSVFVNSKKLNLKNTPVYKDTNKKLLTCTANIRKTRSNCYIQRRQK